MQLYWMSWSWIFRRRKHSIRWTVVDEVSNWVNHDSCPANISFRYFAAFRILPVAIPLRNYIYIHICINYMEHHMEINSEKMLKYVNCYEIIKESMSSSCDHRSGIHTFRYFVLRLQFDLIFIHYALWWICPNLMDAIGNRKNTYKLVIQYNITLQFNDGVSP